MFNPMKYGVTLKSLILFHWVNGQLLMGCIKIFPLSPLSTHYIHLCCPYRAQCVVDYSNPRRCRWAELACPCEGVNPFIRNAGNTPNPCGAHFDEIEKYISLESVRHIWCLYNLKIKQL